MKTQYKYIHFEQVESKTKTSVWSCLNNKSKSVLGIIKWYGPWRQYCWFPFGGTVFNRGCNDDINDFITQLMDERKTKMYELKVGRKGLLKAAEAETGFDITAGYVEREIKKETNGT